MYGPGTVLANRYRLDERIGGGGMGEVWRGTDQVLERTVAVKMMRHELVEEPGFAERFLSEARTMAAIKHPGVVAIHDYQGDEAIAFLVMEYVEGEALSRRLHRFGRIDPVRTMRLIAQAADALHAAHLKGVVHRDIKPGNLLVTATDTVILTDFGIARSAASTPLTATGAVVGTPSYLAPEQVLGKPATARSDVYALGVVAYECLTGRRPFDGDNPFEIAMKRLREPPPPLTDHAPPEVVAVVDRALAADPEQRWQTAAELAEAARRAAGGAAAAPAADPGPTEAAGAAKTTPAAASGSAKPAEFAPARVPVAEPRPASPPTKVEPPPPEPNRPASQPTVVPPPAPAPPSPPPATAPPPAYPTPPPPWQPPPRPVVVSMAAVLLLVSSVALTLYFGGTLRSFGPFLETYESYLDNSGVSDPAGAAQSTGLLGRLVTGAGLVMSLLTLLLTWPVLRGRRAARGWVLTFGAFLLCCCGIPIAVDSFGNGLGTLGTTPADREALNQILVEQMPSWYPLVSGPLPVIGLAGLLAATFLLNLPPAVRYFHRPRFTSYYQQYYYPYPPYRYGYPPHR